jgi:hypothetical protein
MTSFVLGQVGAGHESTKFRATDGCNIHAATAHGKGLLWVLLSAGCKE